MASPTRSSSSADGSIVAPGETALSAKQQTALVKLVDGHSVLDSAKAAGVSRSTLHRWLKEDPTFAAAYHAWQEEAVTTARSRLLALADDAVTTVAAALKDGDTKTALTLLRTLGILQPPTPGPTDPAEVQREQAITARRRQNELSDAELMSALDFDDPKQLLP